ncbi:MAG: C40 family peptidase [Chitinophagales bacterium]|nr:C40 family peptidase [Chitinophagales bacterium]
MPAKKIILILCLFLTAVKLSAQNPQPWWVTNPFIDSSAIKREVIADSILQFAKTFMYVPYVWGGATPEGGFDCSGFVRYVYKKFGIELPRTSGEQFDAGYPIPYVEAEKGDLILFTGMTPVFGTPAHVGIVISRDDQGFTFIHTASEKTGGVHISHSTDPSFYERFLEIRRVIIIPPQEK